MSLNKQLQTMSKHLLFLLLTLSTSFFAQVKFEKGYLIKNNDERSHVLIKNEDWLKNPTQITFKATEDGAQQTAQINEIKQFGIDNFSRYVRFTGKIDVSTDNLQRLTHTSEPVWETQTVWLKVLSSGKRNLYSYRDKENDRFFYSDESTPIEQLVYKRYYPGGNTSNAVSNNYYRQQLQTYFAGEEVGNKLRLIPYKEGSLTQFFHAYNELPKQTVSTAEKSKFNLYARPGISIGSADLLFEEGSTANATFESNIGPRFGIELEYVLPFNRNKWSVITEPTFISYKQTGKNSGNTDVSVKFAAIEIPMGFRHYMYLNSSSKLFVDAVFNVANFQVGEGNLQYIVAGTTYQKYFDLSLGLNMGFGLGYNFKDKFMIQARQYTRKELTTNYVFETGYYNFSLIFGYNIL